MFAELVEEWARRELKGWSRVWRAVCCPARARTSAPGADFGSLQGRGGTGTRRSEVPAQTRASAGPAREGGERAALVWAVRVRSGVIAAQACAGNALGGPLQVALGGD